jgi:hypothetical protein
MNIEQIIKDNPFTFEDVECIADAFDKAKIQGDNRKIFLSREQYISFRHNMAIGPMGNLFLENKMRICDCEIINSGVYMEPLDKAKSVKHALEEFQKSLKDL